MSKSATKKVVVAFAMTLAFAVILWLIGSRRSVDSRSAVAVGTTSAPRRSPRFAAMPQLQPRRDPIRVLSATALSDPTAETGLLSGVVVDDSTGQGIANAEVVFQANSQAQSTLCDDAGAFRFHPSRAEPLQLAVVTAAGYLPYASAWGASPITFYPSEGEHVGGIILYLSPARPYRGRVLDLDGTPVSGAAVRILGSGYADLETTEASFVSSQDGSFRFYARNFETVEASAPG